MKKLLLLIALITLNTIAVLHGQTLTINEFKSQTLEYFDGDGQKITRDLLKSGFTLRLKKDAKLKKAFAKDRNSVFADGILPPFTDKQNFIEYIKIKFPEIPSNDEIEIQIFNDDAVTAIIKLKVAPQNDPDCRIVLSNADASCPARDASDNFGLKEADFEEGDVIYVYNFDKVTTKRRIYKVSFERKKWFAKKEFGTRKVNMSKETLRGGEQVWIKLHNVNRFTNEVKIQAINVNFVSDPSPLLNSFFIGDSSIQSTLIKTFSDKTFAQNAGKHESEVTKMVDAIKCFNTMYSDLGKEVVRAYDPCAEFNCCNQIDMDKVVAKLNEINSGIAFLQLSYTDQKVELAKLKREKDACTAISDNIKKLKTRIAELEKIAVAARTAEQKEELENKKLELTKLTECPSLEVEARNKSIDKLTEELSVVTGLVDIQNKLPKIEEIRSLIIFLKNIIEQNQNLMKGPVQLTGNRLDISYEIKSIDSVIKQYRYAAYKDTAYYKLPILGRPFVSFSSGSFVSINKHLQNKTYTWQQTVGVNNGVDSSGYTLVESGYSLPVMGFAAFANLEWKLNRSFGLGVSAGVGATIENSPRLAYLSGVSLFFGDDRQLALTGGFSGMQVNKLTSNFQSVSDRQIVYPTNELNNLYYKEFKVGFFVSVAYTPFKMAKNN